MSENSKTKHRKDRIMEAALRIFAEKGFQNSTIAEISKEAGVSEATIYEYFGTKEDLLFSIPEKVSRESNRELEQILPFLSGVEDRMRAILRTYVRLYQTNPHYSALVLLQLMSNKRFRQTTAHGAIRDSAHLLLDSIQEGIRNGNFKKDSNPYLIRSILLGTIEHMFIYWHMRGGPKDMVIMDLLDPFMEIVLNGIRAKEEGPGLTLNLKLENAGAIGDFIRQAQKLVESKETPERSQPGDSFVKTKLRKI